MKINLQPYTQRYGFWPVTSAVILLFVIIMSLSFAVISAIVYIICWSFGYPFSFKLVIGLWIVFALLKSIFRR